MMASFVSEVCHQQLLGTSCISSLVGCVDSMLKQASVQMSNRFFCISEQCSRRFVLTNVCLAVLLYRFSAEPIEAEVEDEEERFLNSLTEDERRLVLEELQRQEQELKTTSSASASSSSSSSRKHSSKRSRSESPSSSPSRSRSREKHRKHHKHSDKKRRKSSPSPSRSHSRVGRKEKD